METTITIKSEEKASRVELVIRFFYMIPLFIVMYILSMVAMIGMVVNFITSLLLGKRLEALSKIVVVYIEYNVKMMEYLYVNDERPPIIPKF